MWFSFDIYWLSIFADIFYNGVYNMQAIISHRYMYRLMCLDKQAYSVFYQTRMGGRANVSPYVGIKMVPASFFNEAGTSLGLEKVHIDGARVWSHAGLITVIAVKMIE